jgi:5'-nucleotidase
VLAALGAAVLVTILFATRGSAIQRELKETGERIREKLPDMPEVPNLPGLPGAVPGTGSGDVAQVNSVPAGQPGEGTPAGETGKPPASRNAESPGEGPADKAADKPTEKKPPPYTLKEPPPVAATRHTVMPGDTLYSLAETYYEDGALWPLIAKANGLKAPGELREGSEVVIPGRR